MSIIFDSNNNTITLHTDHTSYQMKIGPLNLLLHTYYGPKARGDMSYSITLRDRGFSGNPYDAGYDRTISADTLPLEYPCEGSGDYRACALGVKDNNGTCSCDLRYVTHTITEGKYKLSKLPFVQANDAKVQTLTVMLTDKTLNLEVYLQYGVFPELDVITRSVRLKNAGVQRLTVTNVASLSLDILSGEWDLMNFHGRHANERNVLRETVKEREIVIGSRRGTSSHHQNPFIILAGKDTNEEYGRCFGMGLLYSGSFSSTILRDPFGTTRAVMGVQSQHFDYPLLPGEVFESPEAVLAYSNEGLTPLSHIFHKLVSEHICRGPWKDKRRPVLINNWEATGMDFDKDKIVSIAKTAASLGVEMMVLDDGWFGKRDNDLAGLGDWTTNTQKLGGTMGELASEIRNLGMKFGLWIEPEMVNEDSELYKAHPDWAFKIPGRDPVRSRYQLVLDFSRPEIVDYVFDQIAKVLDECHPDYIKMDMNRSICDVYSNSLSTQSQGKTLYDYTIGVYSFMDKLLNRYPNLLLEGCSGGGGRFDLGMLFYCPQIWTSDNTDAIDRIKIQYGTSFAYPVSTMGAHVSAVPNGDTKRVVPINTRAVVAMSGTFGYELDLNLISDVEKEAVKKQIVTFKKYYDLLQHGLFYRLTDATKNMNEAAWMTVSNDKKEALLNMVILSVSGNGTNRFIKLSGLGPDASYKDSDSGIIYPASALMSQGFPIKLNHEGFHGEYDAIQVHFEKI